MGTVACCLKSPLNVIILTALIGMSLSVTGDSGTELRERTVLRVCSDPSNLPYSNRLQQGFENEIADLVAKELGVTLVYYWFPQSAGFVRTTLDARRCDLVIGISAGNEKLLNTNPYYSSAFALVYPVNSKHQLDSLSDPYLKTKKLRIGLIAGTPPTSLLLENQLMEQVASYHLVVDTRVDAPANQIMKDVLANQLDVAVLWGPLAGYLNKKYENQFEVVPLINDHSEKHRMLYNITMGVRFGEIEWKRQLNRFLRQNKDKINAILLDYNIPLVEL